MDGIQLLVRRLVEAEPHEAVLALAGRRDVGEGELTRLAASFLGSAQSTIIGEIVAADNLPILIGA